MQWMAWTTPTALFFVGIASMLVVMSALEVVYPTVLRKGYLPIATTRGDRLFIGLVTSGFIHLAWLGLAAEWSLWWASAISVGWLAALLRWG